MNKVFASGAVFVLVLAPLGLLSSHAASTEPICRILNVKDSAWILPASSSVRRTAQKGMRLSEGDAVELTKGNSVDLAFDGAGENVLHLEGEARLLIQAGGRSIRLNLDKGRVYSLLDGLETVNARNFDVSTPVSVSSVRGTYFSVETNGLTAQTAVFKGSTQVSGRRADGRLFGAVFLKPAQMTEVREGSAPSKPALIARSLFDRVNQILELFDFFREKLNYDSAVAALNSDAGLASLSGADQAGSRSILVRLGDASVSAPPTNDDGNVVF